MFTSNRRVEDKIDTMKHILKRKAISDWEETVDAAMNEVSFEHCSDEYQHDMQLEL